MKTKRIVSTFLALTMVLSMPLYAFADITQTVCAGFGEGQEQHITVNDNVTVANEVNAVIVEAHAPEAFEDKNASANIQGNVTATNESSFSAVYVEGRNGDATATITGNLNATGSGDVRAVETWGHSYNGTGCAFVNIGGNLTATASNATASGIDNEYGDVSVTKDVTVTGNKAIGIESYCEANINIGGNLKATGTDYACGAYIYTAENNQHTITVGKDIDATCTSDDVNSEAEAVSFNTCYGNTSADFKGNVIAKNEVGKATGLRFYSSNGGFELSPAYYNVKVGNSIISDDYGIEKSNDTGKADLLVENEVKAEKTAVLLRDLSSLYDQADDGSSYSANQLNLTAWKMSVNKNGNVAEIIVDSEEAVAAKDFEKKINYIIKVQQPEGYGTLSFVDENGIALKKVNDYFVAHEGDKVVVKPNLISGYRVTAAYNGADEKVPLLKDESGNFYIIVPKGGGINISVDVEKAPADVTPVTPTKKTKKANPLKIKGKKVTLKASKLADKKQIVSVKKAIKFVQKGKGTITYKKIKGNKKITLNKKTGKFTVKKGLKKGTYKVKVQVTAAGNSDYKKAVKKTTVKIVVN